MSTSASVSHWLDELDPILPRPALDGAVDFDVALVGGGFSALWTAWHISSADPSLRIAIVEQTYVGFGASGRNGGWATSNMGLSAGELAERYGKTAAQVVVDGMRESVDAIGRDGPDCDYRKNGVFAVARGTGQIPSLRHSYDSFRAIDRADGIEWFDGPDARANVHATRIEAGLYNPYGASVQPAKLARGLADQLETRGVKVYEGSPVIAVHPASGPHRARLETAAGSISAGVVVQATEAWTASLAPKRRLLPVYSLIVITEPLTDDQWEGVGWARGECLASHQLTVDYLTKTPDGRIMFGGRGAPYHFGSRIEPEFDHHDPTHAMLKRAVVDWWPHLEGIGFDRVWGGPLGIPRDFTPNLGYDRVSGLARIFGYVGQGVATTHLAGKYLAADILGTADDLPPLPFLGHTSRKWEPEPVRWLGARFVQERFAAIDRRTERTGIPPSGRTLAERLFYH